MSMDWWSVKVMTFEMLTGNRPSKFNKEEDMTKLSAQIVYNWPVIPHKYSIEARLSAQNLMQKIHSREDR
jgi:serine/threonine protein kinase